MISCGGTPSLAVPGQPSWSALLVSPLGQPSWSAITNKHAFQEEQSLDCLMGSLVYSVIHILQYFALLYNNRKDKFLLVHFSRTSSHSLYDVHSKSLCLTICLSLHNLCVCRLYVSLSLWAISQLSLSCLCFGLFVSWFLCLFLLFLFLSLNLSVTASLCLSISQSFLLHNSVILSPGVCLTHLS